MNHALGARVYTVHLLWWIVGSKQEGNMLMVGGLMMGWGLMEKFFS